MYTRCPSIASIFQKAILLKDTKCNKIIQRQLRSESLVKFPKVELKLKPMKRCFSGASNTKNSMPKTRNIQGFGNTRKTLPKKPVPNFPIGLFEHQPMRLDQNQNNQKIVGDLVNQSSNESTQNSAKITIVIDKNEICNCSSPNESVVIHVTTKPETAQRKRLSDADIEDVCNTKYNCEPGTNSRSPNVFPTTPAQLNFSNDFNKRQQNVFGLPLRSFSAFDDGRPLKMETLNLKNSRSMSDFPGMRKMILPSDFHQMNQNIGQLKMQHSPSVQRTRSESRLNPTGGNIINQTPSLQQTMGPNTPQIQRHFSLFGQPTQNSTPNRLMPPKQRITVFERADQHVKSHPVLQNLNAKRMEQFNRQQRKYSSFHQNEIPVELPYNNPADKQSKQQKYATKIDRSGRKIDEQYHPRPKMVERVIRPATFSPNDRTVSNNNGSVSTALKQAAAIQKLNSIRAPTQKRIAANLFDGPFVRKPGHFNLQQITSKNKFPVGRASAPRMLTFQGQNPSITHGNFINRNMVNQTQFSVQRQPPLNKRFERRPTFNRNNQLKNLQPLNKHSANRMNSYTPTKHSSQIGVCGNPNFVNSQEIGTRNKFPPKNGRSPLIAPSPSCFLRNNKLQPNQRRTILMPLQHRPPQWLLKRPVQHQPPPIVLKRPLQHQPPQFLLKKRNALRPARSPSNFLPNKLQPNQRLTMLMPVQHRPPQFLLKKKNALRPAISHQLNGQSSQNRRSYIPVVQIRNPQQRNLAHREGPKFVPIRNSTTPAPTSMIPVRKNVSVQRIMPPNSFLQLHRSRTSSLGKIPIEPRVIAHAQLTHNNLMDSTKRRKPTGLDKLQKRSDIRRMNQDKLQSSLPVSATNPRNQIEKYVEQPKSLQIVGRPYSNQGNINRPRTNETIQRFNGIAGSNFRLQQMPLVRQTTPPMNDRKSLPQEQTTTQPDKRKENSPTTPQPPVVTPKTNNPAVLFYAPDKLRLVDLPVPRLSDEEGVIVKMLYVHLTDTDAQILSAIQNGPYKLIQPTIAGKSGSGVIVEVGKKVETVKIGDKVSVKGMSCGKCTACENDNEVMCERVPIIEKLGILKRFHAVPAKFVARLPDAVHLIDGAMIDELSSAIRACKKSTVTAGDNVLVLGGKSLGLWTALAAKSMGATNVCLADHRPLLLEQAKKLGIERVFLINPETHVLNICKNISEHMDGQCPRIVFDCNGCPLSNAIAINTTIIGGKVVLMKNSVTNKPIVLSNAVVRGIDILSSQHGNNDSDRAAVQFLASGKVQLNGIESTFFHISNVHAAFGLLNSPTISNIFVQPSQPDDEKNAKKTTKTS